MEIFKFYSYEIELNFLGWYLSLLSTLVDY